MKKNKLVVLIALLAMLGAMAIGVYVFFRLRSGNEDAGGASDESGSRPRLRSRQDIEREMSERMAQAKLRLAEIKSLRESEAGGGKSRYYEDLGKNTADAVIALEESLAKGKRNQELGDKLKLEFENDLKARQGMSGVSLKQTDCIDALCRAVVVFENDEAMSAFHKSMSEEPFKKGSYSFLVSENQGLIKAGQQVKEPLKMQTRVFVSNTDAPLPIDKKLQLEPKE